MLINSSFNSFLACTAFSKSLRSERYSENFSSLSCKANGENYDSSSRIFPVPYLICFTPRGKLELYHKTS
mgnify:CR=1 FL=1